MKSALSRTLDFDPLLSAASGAGFRWKSESELGVVLEGRRGQLLIAKSTTGISSLDGSIDALLYSPWDGETITLVKEGKRISPPPEPGQPSSGVAPCPHDGQFYLTYVHKDGSRLRIEAGEDPERGFADLLGARWFLGWFIGPELEGSGKQVIQVEVWCSGKLIERYERRALIRKSRTMRDLLPLTASSERKLGWLERGWPDA